MLFTFQVIATYKFALVSRELGIWQTNNFAYIQTYNILEYHVRHISYSSAHDKLSLPPVALGGAPALSLSLSLSPPSQRLLSPSSYYVSIRTFLCPFGPDSIYLSPFFIAILPRFLRCWVSLLYFMYTWVFIYRYNSP